MTVEKATPAKAAELTQDPPRARDGPEKTLELAIGRALRGFRRRQEVTVAELASRSTPAVRGDSLGLAEDRDEDLRLFVAVSREGVQPSEQFLAGIDASPQICCVPVVPVSHNRTDLVDSLTHQARKPMNRRLLTADADKVIFGHRRNLAGVEVPESLSQSRWASKGPFHGNLLVKQHAKQ